MKASRFVVKNTALLTLGLFSGRLLGFFIFRRLTGLEGAEGTGVWGTAVDLTSIVIVVANFGLGALVTREIVKARQRTAAIFLSALRIRLVLGLATYALLTGYVFVTGYDSEVRLAVMVMALGVILEAAAMACDAVLQAHERVEYQTASQIVSAVAYFGLAWWWLDLGYGLMGIIWANVASRAARLAVILPLMLRHTGPWRGGEKGGVDVRWLMRMAMPVFLSTTFGIIAYKIDTVMIMEMLGKFAAGIYTTGHRPLDLLVIMPNLFATALFPSLQRYRETGENPLEDVQRMAGRSLRYLHLLVFPITMVCLLGARPLIGLLAAGEEFAPAAGVFAIVILGLPLVAANTVYNRVLLSMNREKVFLKLASTVMVVNVGLNLVLIPWLEWNGAAIATVGSQVVSHLLHRNYIRHTGLRIPWRRGHLGGTLALIAAWFAAAAVLRLAAPGWGVGWTHLPQSNWPALLGACALTGVFYAAALAALRVLRREDLAMVRELRS